MSRIFRIGLLFLMAATFRIPVQAEDQPANKTVPTSGELFDTIAKMDAAIFGAFNAHDAERLMALFTDDLEFYHDSGGLSDNRQTGDAFKKMFASTPDIRRDLVKSSLEVYPVKDYGAMEIGEHKFCHKENRKDNCGTFKFAMVWRKTGESWKISRVLSWGH